MKNKTMKNKTMKPRRILKNKKGIALENAILFMVIVFSFCALLTSLTLFGHYQTKLDKITLTNKVALEQIGEDFLADDMKPNYENYTLEINENTLTVTNTNGTVVLYVEKDGGKIIQWRYSSPTE